MAQNNSNELSYRGLRGTLERLIVSEAQVDQQIERLLEQHVRTIPVTDRPSQLDDELVLDYAGYVDGVQFSGGTAQKQSLVLGSGAFIPGFEAQLVGKSVGDQVDVRVTFPEAYHAQELAGREAVFKCTIHEIRLRRKAVPDDAFAREVGGFESFEALREHLRTRMQAYADQKADEDLKARLLDQLLENCAISVGGKALDKAVDMEMKALEAQLSRQGLTLDAYCQFTGKSREQLRDECRPDALKTVRRQRVIADIAEAEHIEADEASVTEAIQNLCRENNMTIDQLSAYLNEDAQNAIVRGVIADKVLDFLRDNAVLEVVEKQM